MFFSKRTTSNVAIAIVAVLIIVIIILSWKSSPILSNLPLLPKSLLFWADLGKNENSRTAVPFIGLGILVCLSLLLNKAKAIRYFIACIVCMFFLALVELVQLYIPHRHADIGDVAWGSVGFIAGLTATLLAWWLLIRFMRRTSAKK